MRFMHVLNVDFCLLLFKLFKDTWNVHSPKIPAIVFHVLFIEVSLPLSSDTTFDVQCSDTVYHDVHKGEGQHSFFQIDGQHTSERI